VIETQDANEEMKHLGEIDTKTELVIDKSFGAEIPKVPAVRDTAATIECTHYQPNKLNYKISTKTPQVAVFSEIYYDKGWNATINDKKQPYVRVNYLLRGMELPAGDYELIFAFEPKSYSNGNIIALTSSIVLILAFAGYLFLFWKKKKSTNIKE
jgi:uncharacterized membrane protein YfhO